MGVLTLGDGNTNFRSEVQFFLENRTDAATTGTAGTERLDRWVNQAYNHVCHPSIFKHHELQALQDITLVTNDNDYALATSPQITGVYSVFLVEATTVTNTARKRKMFPVQINNQDQRTLTSGRPSRYAIDGLNIIIDPVPTATENGWHLQVRHWREPTRLSAASNVTAIPFYWDEVIVIGATWRAMRDLGYRALAEEQKQDMVGLINEIQPSLELEGDDWGWQPPLEIESAMSGVRP